MKLCLLSYSPDAERILAAAAYATSRRESARLCLRTITEEEIRRMLEWTKEMKLSSVLDFPYFVFCFEEVSRAFTHQWVRYRIAAHMQQSLRYTEVDVALRERPWFVVPPSILKTNNENLVVSFVESQLRAGQEYRRMLNAGIPVEDARFSLPASTKTHIATAMDGEELLHVIYQRCCFDAQWEIRAAGYLLYAMGLLVSPRMFRGSGPSCVSEGICRGRRKGECKPDVEELLAKVGEKVESSRSDFEKLEPKHEFELDFTDLLGYRSSAKLEKAVGRRFGLERLDLSFKTKLLVMKA